MSAMDATAAGSMLLTYKYRLNPERRQHRALPTRGASTSTGRGRTS